MGASRSGHRWTASIIETTRGARSTHLRCFARQLYEDRRQSGAILEEVLVDIALTRTHGWHLPAFAPGTFGYLDPLHGSPEELEEGRFVLPSPFRFSWTEFEEYPDHAGYMLVRQAYQAFHLPQERIPKAYDKKRRKLVMEGE